MTDRLHSGSFFLKMIIVAFILSISASMAVGAELYRYKDKSGAVRYTDDLTKVPDDQRTGMKKIVTPTPSESKTGEVITIDEAAVKEATADKEISPESELRQLEFERLIQEKKMLDEEYADLLKTKETLAKDKEKLDAKSYNEQANELNERISAYEERRDTFKKAADAYNEQIKAKE